MNARKITIISTRDQKQSVIMSTAETLGDLKDDMQEAGISYEGLTFHERISKVELKENSARLPHDVPYRGNVTNELVFLLTNTETKIKSGLISRVEAYAYIKDHNLQDECIAALGRNFTQCQTVDLESLIEDYKTRMQEQTRANQAQSSYEQPEKSLEDKYARAAIKELVKLLHAEGMITVGQSSYILSTLDTPMDAFVSDYDKEGESPYSDMDAFVSDYDKEGESPYSDEEIRNLIGM